MLNTSSILLNYVEPYNYNGVLKTTFYTQFATNFNVGDKVFIVNGNYDTNLLILSDLFAYGNDGYKILLIDRCKIVLDINWTGQIVFNEDNIDNFIKLYNISSQREFDYINTITNNSYATFSSKFEYGITNNLIWAGASFSGTTSTIGLNNGITSSGFFQKNSYTHNWTNITHTFSNGSIYFKTTGTGITYSLTNNNRILVIGDDFNAGSYSLPIFKENAIYQYNSGWKIDVSYMEPLITKTNFRNGTFKGTWNDGVFGCYDNIVNWNGSYSTWNSGIILNTNWLSGVLNSRNNAASINNYNNTGLLNPQFITAPVNTIAQLNNNFITARDISFNSPKSINNNLIEYYYCYLDENGNPIQSTDYSNNKGYGFNYVIDSSINTGTLVNGNFINSNIGTTSSINTLDVYYGLSYSYLLNSLGGYFSLCDINTALLNNSNIINCNVINSNLIASKLTSNQIHNTVANGDYNASGINIINADLWSYMNGSQKRGILKLYITDNDLLNLSNFDAIYIDDINKQFYLSSLTDDNKVYLNYENKYILDYISNTQSMAGFTSSIIVSTKNSNENLFKSYISFSASSSSYINNYLNNDIILPSIDIDLGENLAWYFDGTSSNIYINSNPIITTDNVSNLFTNTNIHNSDFKSGILLQSNWNAGDHFNDLSNRIITNSSTYSIHIPSGSTNSITIDINNATYNKYDNLNIGDYVFLNGLSYITSSTCNFNTTFKVASQSTSVIANSRRFVLNEQTNVIYNNGLTASGQFIVNGVNPNYLSIHKFKIDYSNISNGLFNNTLITNTNINNDNFDNTDNSLILGNVNLLRFINTLFNNDNNSINSGVIYNSHILNTLWNNGLAYNSVLLGTTFSNGTFKNGYWLNGVFNGGQFTDSDTITSTLFSFDNQSYYRAWRYGIFNGGQIFNSSWIDGVFNGGQFFNADWYSGVFNGGIFGSKNLPNFNTTMGSYANLGTGSTCTVWNNGTVESGVLGGGSYSLFWYNGNFNNGEFTSAGTYSSIWYNGNFNGGKFDGFAQWVNGILHNGKFLSSYGWTNSNSTLASDYSWQNGTFLAGQFGSGNLGTNSTWYDGIFKGGNFLGRVWNKGTFYNGNFYGSATISITASYTKETNFVNSFTSSYYGLWRDGYAADLVHLGKPDLRVSTTILRNVDTRPINNSINFQNMLWLNGTFSHGYGTMQNSAWLNGTFVKGNFINSAFNPFADNTLMAATPSFNFNNSCVWQNGNFNGGNFYISKWLDGNFNTGNMLGGIWLGGIWYYGNAYNTYWTGGDWKNGNWYGTNFIGNTSSITANYIYDPMIKSVLYNVASYSGTGSIHLLNAFTSSYYIYDNSNNKLYNTFGFTISMGQTAYTPHLVLHNTGGVHLNFGNGAFLDGLWENGVWNNGYRKDTNLLRCNLQSTSPYIKINKNTHRILLTVIDNNTLSLGEVVSVGNIIAIDINGNRKLIKNTFTVIYCYLKNIGLEITLNYPIQQLTQDSLYHVIYVSTNIWLNGTFLNGYFSGIWNDGLFNGYPYITFMENSHFIDGTINGGHIKGLTSSYINNSSATVSYNTTVIQNCIFYDNNIDTATNFTYQTWLDLNFVTYSMVNLNQTTNFYDTALNTVLSNTNLNGYVSYDVLSSVSTFRDGFGTNSLTYNLGIKYKKYYNYLGNGVGTFDRLFSSTISSLGMNNFYLDGWTYSLITDSGGRTSSYDIWNTSNELFLHSVYELDMAYPQIILNNSNININKNRYSVIEFIISSYSVYDEGPYSNLQFINQPAAYSLYPNSVDYPNSGQTIKQEFYFNKYQLNMTLQMQYGSGNTCSLTMSFDNIAFYETDMIPFFQYTTEANVDQVTRTPLTGIAPYINYSNNNIKYIS